MAWMPRLASACVLCGVVATTCAADEPVGAVAAGGPIVSSRVADAGPREPPQARQADSDRHGLSAIVHETAADFRAFPGRRSTWIILTAGAAGAALAHPVDDDVNRRLVLAGRADRVWSAGHVLGDAYVQLGTAAGLYLAGRFLVHPDAGSAGPAPTSRLSHLGFDLLRAQVVSQAVTQGIKIAVRRDRPTGRCCSFPSGHATAAFATATVLDRHLGYRAGIPLYALATYVAASRLHDNVHFLSDVTFGASVGAASGWSVVGRHGSASYTLVPSPVPGGITVSVVRATSDTR